MRSFAILLAALALSGCDAPQIEEIGEAPASPDAVAELEASIQFAAQFQDPEQEAELLARLDDVLSRDDVDPVSHAALAEIAALLRETQ